MYNFSEELKISLGGENHVDVETLTNVLQGTLESVQASTKKVIDDHTTSKLVVKSVTEGSFIIECVVFIAHNSQQLFDTAKGVLNVFKTGLELRKHLKGEEPKKVEINNQSGDVTVVNVNNSSITIDGDVFSELSTNSELKKGLTKIHKDLEQDTDRTYIEFGFKNSDEEEKIIVLEEEIPNMSFEPDLAQYLSDIEENIMETTIRVTRLDFQKNIKWNFILNGKTESAYIEDNKFLEDVKSNKYMFGANTFIRVTLKSIYRVDARGFPLETERPEFTIMKVHEVINANEEQGKFLI